MAKCTVTASDIKRGKPGECDSCAIALAMRRQTGLPWNVDQKRMWIEVEDLEIEVKLPKKASKFVERFDGETYTKNHDVKHPKKGCKPFTFAYKYVAEKTENIDNG